MATMISEVYDALKDAGASEEKARKAAEALAGYEDKFVRIEARFARVDERFAQIEGKITLLQWMVGFNLAMTTAVLWKVFS
jgi:hypothetical protein